MSITRLAPLALPVLLAVRMPPIAPGHAPPPAPSASAGSSAGPAPIRFLAAAPPTPVGPMPGTPAILDLDGDGDLDVAVACGPCCGREPDPASGHVRILLNVGGGVLRPAGDRIPVGPTALGLAGGDVNADGHPDLVVHHHHSYDVAVLLGDGRGGFRPGPPARLHEGDRPHVHAIVLADVDADGHLDVLATLVDDHAMAVLLGDGAGNFRPATGQPYFAHRHPYAQLAVTDHDGDGHLDAVMTDMRGDGLTVLLGSGTGMFAPWGGFRLETSIPVRTAERPMACSLGDLDGDGDLDVVVFTDESPVAVRLLRGPDGRFREPDDAGIDLGLPAIGGTLADLDGDGTLDIVASITMSRDLVVCRGRPGATFDAPRRVPSGGMSPHVRAADMNGDGRPDLVAAHYESGTVSVLLNLGGR